MPVLYDLVCLLLLLLLLLLLSGRGWCCVWC
jgi:hypothetical protein